MRAPDPRQETDFVLRLVPHLAETIAWHERIHVVQLVGVDVEQYRREPSREHERSRERLLLDRREWPHVRATTQLQRDVGMLAEYQQVFRGERQDERHAEQAQARRGTEDDDDRAINDEESRHVCRQGALVLTLRGQRLQTRRARAVSIV